MLKRSSRESFRIQTCWSDEAPSFRGENLRKTTQKIRLDPGETLDQISSLVNATEYENTHCDMGRWRTTRSQPPKVNAGLKLG